MPTYVLIWIVITNPSGQDGLPQSVATHSQEFEGAAACLVARDWLRDSTHTASDKVKGTIFADKNKPPDKKATEFLLSTFASEAQVTAQCVRNFADDK
jgi:hypothetical protein